MSLPGCNRSTPAGGMDRRGRWEADVCRLLGQKIAVDWDTVS